MRLDFEIDLLPQKYSATKTQGEEGKSTISFWIVETSNA